MIDRNIQYSIKNKNKVFNNFRFYKNLYIGYTSDIESRYDAHKKDKDFDQMVILFRSENLEEAKKIENLLINKFKDKLINKNSGGGGSDSDGPYFIYLLRKHK